MKRENKTLKVASIRAPGDIESVRKEALTLEIGESYAATGGQPVDPIIVEAGTLALKGGKHRFAAALNCGLKHIDAIVIDGTPEEIETFALVEQVRRRRSSDAEISRLVELQHPTPEQTFPELKDEEVPWNDKSEDVGSTIEPEPPLAPKSKVEAIKAVAEVTGKTEAAVRQADYRARKAKDTQPEPPSEPVAACIDTCGVPVSDDVLRDAQEHMYLLVKVRATLTAQQAAITRFAKDHGNLLLRINEPIHDATFLAIAHTPASVCLWCKCVKSRRKGCPGCKGSGWVTAGALKAITDERLRKRGSEAGIWVDGKWVKLSEVK